MYEILKAICVAENWPFTYARKDFQNLFDEAEKVGIPHIFLDPVVIEDVENDMNVTEEKVYSGNFMILASSDLDKDYEDRFQEYIKPLIDTAIVKVKESIRCGGEEVTFNLWRSVEVVNVFDYNFDGLIVSYNITIAED